LFAESTLAPLVGIEVETDSLNLVSALHSSEFDLASAGVLLRDIRTFIRLNFIHKQRCCFRSSYLYKLSHAIAAVGANKVADRVLCVDSP
jgi:hypothetical protein